MMKKNYIKIGHKFERSAMNYQRIYFLFKNSQIIPYYNEIITYLLSVVHFKVIYKSLLEKILLYLKNNSI